MKPLLTIALCLLCLTAVGQPRLTWDHYNRHAKIELLTVNGGLLLYANQKQVLLPVKTQRTVNLIVYPLCIGFTFYKAIEWRERRQRPTDIKYRNHDKNYHPALSGKIPIRQNRI